MDFKNRFPSKPSEASRDPARPSNKQPSNNPFANTFSSVRQPSNPLRPSLQQKSTGLNKFKKAPSQGAAPKGQFKKYMVEANNIFYEDRPELKQLEKVKLCKWALIVIWLLLAVSYALIRRITPYEGVCPPKAKCGVFVRCPELFQYHKEINECRLSKDFLAEIQGAALSRVEQLQYDYGQRECLSQEGTPSFSINELFEELDAEKVGFYRQAAWNYLQTKENQENYGFKLVGRSGLVLPTIKKYSIRCSILLTISDAFKMMVIAGCLLVLVLICWIGKNIMHRQRYSRMYDYLKDRVMQAQDKTLNVTHAMADLQNRFGTIDEQGWGRINDLRANDKKIGFYEDDFLYWKAS